MTIEMSERIRHRYLNDVVFHKLVDSLTATALHEDWSSQDLIDVVTVVDHQVRHEQLRRLVSSKDTTTKDKIDG